MHCCGVERASSLWRTRPRTTSAPGRERALRRGSAIARKESSRAAELPRRLDETDEAAPHHVITGDARPTVDFYVDLTNDLRERGESSMETMEPHGLGFEADISRCSVRLAGTRWGSVRPGGS